MRAEREKNIHMRRICTKFYAADDSTQSASENRQSNDVNKILRRTSDRCRENEPERHRDNPFPVTASQLNKQKLPKTKLLLFPYIALSCRRTFYLSNAS